MIEAGRRRERGDCDERRPTATTTRHDARANMSHHKWDRIQGVGRDQQEQGEGGGMMRESPPKNDREKVGKGRGSRGRNRKDRRNNDYAADGDRGQQDVMTTIRKQRGERRTLEGYDIRRGWRESPSRGCL